MKIKDIAFMKSVSINNSKIFFEERNEVVFVGRSNVGKSSLMNALFNKKSMVKTSSKPGKTRTANIFRVNHKYYFTDLPGYGFAKLGKDLREDLDSLISWYIEERRGYIKKVVLIVDSKIGPQETDIEMFSYIQTLELPIIIVLSKTDRLNTSDIHKSKTHCQEVFFGQEIISTSVKKKTGLKELMRILGDSLKG